MHQLASVIALIVAVQMAGLAQFVDNPAWTFFAPPNDVSFTLSLERPSYGVLEDIPVRYRIVNVSNLELLVPQGLSESCPWAVRHVSSWFEDAAGRHTIFSYVVSCPQSLPIVARTLSERLSKGAVSLRPGDHLEGTIPMRLPAGLPGGTYRIEATLWGWSDERFTAAERDDLAKLDNRLLRGEISTSIAIEIR